MLLLLRCMYRNSPIYLIFLFASEINYTDSENFARLRIDTAVEQPARRVLPDAPGIL